MSHDFTAEKEAFASFGKLLSQVDECKRLFERAGLDIPEPLKRLMGTANGNGKRSTRISIPAIDRDYRPVQAVGAQEEWLSIPAVEGTATSLVLAALRDKTTPCRSEELESWLPKSIREFPWGPFTILELGYRRQD